MKKSFLVFAMVIAGSCVAVAASTDEKVVSKPVVSPAIETVAVKAILPMETMATEEKKGSKDCIEYKISCENGSKAEGTLCGEKAGTRLAATYEAHCVK